MKKKYIAATLSLILAVSPVAGYAAVAAEDTTTSSAIEQQADNKNTQAPEGAQGKPPEMPNDENMQGPDGQMPGGGMPDGQNIQSPDGQPPEMPNGENMQGLDGQPPEMPNGENMQQPGGQMPGNQAPDLDSYLAVYTYEEDAEISGETITSTGADENAVLVTGDAAVSLDDVTIDRTSADSTGGDNASFYGIGAAILGAGGNTKVSNSSITTDSSGGAGVFAYGDATVYVADTTITTQQDTSGAIHAAGGGTLYAWNVTAETNGRSSAAVRSDRGGGTMVADGGSYTSNGPDSPAVYCTADISIHDAELTANGSEAVCIEGLNTLRLYDCDLTGNMNDDERNDNTWTVIVYQSMSGDSQVGNGTFQMEGGTLTSGNGGLFYTTNTECTITLKDVEITNAQDSEFFLQCTGNNNTRGWGQTGANGSDCLFTAITQEMQGDILWDSISNLDFYMTQNSTFTGAFLNDETYAGNGGNGYCNVIIDENSSWTVTNDSRISTLFCAGSITDPYGKTVTITSPDGTVFVQGGSEYTIITDSYDTTADLSGCASIDSWEDHQIENL